jgi:peptidoglycan/LPS O-acetylase OafA/YrhL
MKRLIKKSHFDNVNAMRFLAFLAIFSAHAIITYNQQIKVTTLYSDLRQFTANINDAAYSLLFILTGFLNTWSIFEERFIYKKMNVLRFYMRRVFSVLPLYFVAFILGNYIAPFLAGSVNMPSWEKITEWQYLVFIFNFGYEETWNPLLGFTGNMWSIAVSIQFLIVWPFLMDFFRRNETIMFGLLILVFAGFTWITGGDPAFQFNTLNFIPEFVVGGIVAYISFFKYPSYNRLKENTRRTIGATYLVFIVFMVLRVKILNQFAEIPQFVLHFAEKILVAGTLGYFLFEQNFNSNSVLKMAKLKFMTFPGKIAQSLYTYMPLGILVGFITTAFLVDTETLTSVTLLRPFIALFVTFAVSIFSHEYFEKKFLRRKKNYNPTREYNPVGIADVKTKSS